MKEPITTAVNQTSPHKPSAQNSENSNLSVNAVDPYLLRISQIISRAALKFTYCRVEVNKNCRTLFLQIRSAAFKIPYFPKIDLKHLSPTDRREYIKEFGTVPIEYGDIQSASYKGVTFYEKDNPAADGVNLRKSELIIRMASSHKNDFCTPGISAQDMVKINDIIAQLDSNEQGFKSNEHKIFMINQLGKDVRMADNLALVAAMYIIGISPSLRDALPLIYDAEKGKFYPIDREKMEMVEKIVSTKDEITLYLFAVMLSRDVLLSRSMVYMINTLQYLIDNLPSSRAAAKDICAAA